MKDIETSRTGLAERDDVTHGDRLKMMMPQGPRPLKVKQWDHI